MEEVIEQLSAEAGAVMRRLLKDAYERGFRDALATAGRSPSEAQPPQPPPAAPPVPAPPPPAAVAWTAAAESEDDSSVPEGEDDPDDAVVVRPIQPHATVATLRRRINRVFDLGRFDIDVVLCRAGDPDRRQLKGTARLGLYRREGS